MLADELLRRSILIAKKLANHRQVYESEEARLFIADVRAYLAEYAGEAAAEAAEPQVVQRQVRWPVDHRETYIGKELEYYKSVNDVDRAEYFRSVLELRSIRANIKDQLFEMLKSVPHPEYYARLKSSDLDERILTNMDREYRTSLLESRFAGMD